MSPSRRRPFLQRPVQKSVGSIFAGLGEKSSAFARVAHAPSHPSPNFDADPDADPDPTLTLTLSVALTLITTGRERPTCY